MFCSICYFYHLNNLKYLSLILIPQNVHIYEHMIDYYYVSPMILHLLHWGLVVYKLIPPQLSPALVMVCSLRGIEVMTSNIGTFLQ